jgi:hypothetical protein
MANLSTAIASQHFFTTLPPPLRQLLPGRLSIFIESDTPTMTPAVLFIQEIGSVQVIWLGKKGG